jgi:hypothetical protein
LQSKKRKQRGRSATPASATNPFSTGGGGTQFEIKVQSGLLAMLAVHGADPVFADHHVQQLRLQAQNQGVKTDDAMVVSVDASGATSKSLWSIKHEVRFTEADDVFVTVASIAWADFNNASVFNPATDAIVLATTRQSARHAHFLTILEWARAASDAADLMNRVATTHYASEEARTYLGIIRQIVFRTAGSPVDDDRLWRFLRCFYVLTYDLDLLASQDEARFKTMLGMATYPGGNHSGETLWNAICKYVGDLNPRAGAFTRQNLPKWLRENCRTVTAYFGGGIQRLHEHAKGHLSRIRTTVGPKIAIPRLPVIDQILSSLNENQFTVVTGPAGVGKSAAAILALQTLLSNGPLFVFQAMEFARQHLDQALGELRVTETLSQISSLFALHDRKFLLIESVEKLLEAQDRDAFAMLLETVAKDATWQVILTCRLHAITMVQDAFFTPLGLFPAKVNVPILDDFELDAVLAQVSSLSLVAKTPRIRALLRNPWYLDKAYSVDWTKEKSRPVDEPQLRSVLWRRIVARDDYQQGGLHRQREACFRSIALSRAKSLRSFVPINAGHEAAAQALVADGLLVEESSTGYLAPAHDVLEDWALVGWIDENFSKFGEHPSDFLHAIGQELPIRRSFRQWLIEGLANRQNEDVRRFIESAIRDKAIEVYWRDEIMVSILLSGEAAAFINAQEEFLLSDNKEVLMRLLHLLRIACKTPNPFLLFDESKLGALFGDFHLIPKGEAWPEVLRLIVRHIGDFGVAERPLVLGVLQDWKAGIHWKNPTPHGAREAGLIALHYWNLSQAKGSWQQGLWEQIVQLLLAAPQAIAKEFESLVEAMGTSSGNHRGEEEFRRALLMSMNAWAACRFLPDAVIRFAEREWGLLEAPQGKGGFERHHRKLDEWFGLKTGYGLDYFPASALRGPFYPLLQWNREKGVALILKLLNIATERFVTSRFHEGYEDEPIELEVRMHDGSVQKQWANARLWMIHRGSIPAPGVMESALMTLEKWLLDLADTDFDLGPLLFSLLKRSNNVAITSVVASVIIAHPKKFGDVALSLLRVPEFFSLDRVRYIQDQTPVSAFSTGFELPEHRLYYDERAASDKLPHRASHFEWLAQTLQTGDLREQVWKIIDDRKEALPSVELQTDADKIERLLLHRIDLRNYQKAEVGEDRRVVFVASPPAAELQAVIEKATPSIVATNKAAGLLVWGRSVFERRDSEKHDPSKWRETFAEAQTAVRKYDKELQLSYGGGPGYVVAVCVRDHWGELSRRERMWCRNYLVKLVTSGKDRDTEVLRLNDGPMGGAQPAAAVLPLLLQDANTDEERRVCEAIASALTHSENNIRNHAAHGVRLHAWQINPAFVWICVAGLVKFAELQRVQDTREMRIPWQKRINSRRVILPGLYDLRSSIARSECRSAFRLIRLSLKDSFSCQVWPLILCILSDRSDDERARRFFAHFAKAYVRSWDRQPRREFRNYEAESALRRFFAQFSLRCLPDAATELWAPLLDAIPTYADKVSEVFEQVVYAEDQQRSDASFWRLWSEISHRIIGVENRNERLLEEHSNLARLAAVLLLDRVHWKEGAKNWEPLNGHKEDIRQFFRQVGNSSEVCRGFISLLDSVGNQSLLPDGIEWIAEQLRSGSTAALIADRNSLFLLTRVLTPIVYGRTSAARRSRTLREAILAILDAMIDSGSSAAFRMREFLITPMVPADQVAS